MQFDPRNVMIVLPFVAAFVISMVFGPGVISMLKRRGMGQVISSDGPASHNPKAGTPTMGGLIIIAGILAGSLIAVLKMQSIGLAGASGMERPHDLLAVLLLVVAYALVGMVDDYRTIRPIGGVRGIASKPKALVQLLLAFAFVMWLANHRPGGFMPILYIAGHPILQGWLYYAFAVLFIAGMANFINITDGLDGLVTGLTAIAASAMTLIMLPVVLTRGAQLSLFVVLPAIAGACLAFLWFNANPAKVFMGDTGALALGVALPAVAILMHCEVLMIVVGMVFILDGLSSALQWAVFKFTRITTSTGRRVFKKSPIHHHFELSGWAEQTVVSRFYICGVIAAVIGFAGVVAGVF